MVGRWGKAHAMCKALKKNPDVELYAYMDKKNPCIASLTEDYTLGSMKDKEKIRDYAQSTAELVIVSPQMSLSEGVTDFLRKEGFLTVGASKTCAKLEADKGFMRKLMEETGLGVSPRFGIFENKEKVAQYIREKEGSVAIKPAGVTEGHGVRVMSVQLGDKEEAVSYAKKVLDEKIGGLPRVVIEDKIQGEEFTLQAFIDGEILKGTPAVRDYKLVQEGEKGSNTPGMGSYSDSDHLLPFLDKETYEEALSIMRAAITLLRKKYDAKYKGVLSGQFMLTAQGLKLVEFNVRPGDSEILNITPILETDFLEICKAMATGTLDQINVNFREKATVCKYVVPPGFPHPKGNIKVKVNREKIREEGGYLFCSCFQKKKDVYEPSPRLFAVTAVEDSIYKARESCERLLGYIRGKGLYYRRDIGTKQLTEKVLRKEKEVST